VKKAWKLAIVLGLVVGGATLAFAGASPAALKGVTDVARDPAALAGKEIQVKATIAAGSVNRTASPLTFAIEEPGARFPVVWTSPKPIPEEEAGGTIEGRTVVVKGIVAQQGGQWVLLASDMQVGCASKYEPAK
jgi:cytochrome c-type biogenesis protein CcmE